MRGSIDVRHGVTERVEEGCRPLALWVGQPRNSRKTVLGVACPQVKEEFRKSMATPCQTTDDQVQQQRKS
jgi:hypothetical protein